MSIGFTLKNAPWRNIDSSNESLKAFASSRYRATTMVILYDFPRTDKYRVWNKLGTSWSLVIIKQSANGDYSYIGLAVWKLNACVHIAISRKMYYMSNYAKRVII